MTVSLDTTLKQYEQDGGDEMFIKDISNSINVDKSQFRIIQKSEGSLIISFIVQTLGQPCDQLKMKIKNALQNDILYSVLNIDEFLNILSTDNEAIEENEALQA